MTGFIVGQTVTTVRFTKANPPNRITTKGVISKIIEGGYEIRQAKKTVRFMTDHSSAPFHIFQGQCDDGTDGYAGFVENLKP